MKGRLPWSWRDENGLALATALVFTALLLLLLGALASQAVSEARIASYQALGVRNRYLAEGGLEMGLAVLRQDYEYEGSFTVTLEEGSITVLITGGPGESRMITATAFLEDSRRELQVTVEKDPAGNPIVTRWGGP